MRSAAHSKRPASEDYDLRPSTCDLRRSTLHLRPSTCDLRHSSRFTTWLGTVIACLCLFAPLAKAGDLSPEEIIKRFAAKESEFREARQSYTYKTHITAQELSDYGDVRGERKLVIETYFTTDGKRHERTIEDNGQLYSLTFTQEDIDDAANIQPFVLTTEDLPQYQIEYLGKERVDELDTYVFSVRAKHIENHKRYFEGKIWVDDVDLQIVKTDGRAVPQSSTHRYPRFETIRQMIDHKYWFPVWTMGDERLVFGNRLTGKREVRVREIITYEDYKRFEVNTNIKFGAPTPPPQ